MSDGTMNLPKRGSKPDAPATNRYKIYVDGNDDEVKYVDDSDTVRTFKGDKGDQGDQGPVGPQGPQGIQGPAGPMNVEGVADEQGTVTLPNSTTKSVVYSDTFNVSTAGLCFLMVSIAMKPHATNNDYEFDIDLGGNILTPDMAEEGKDSSGAQSNWRTFIFPVGNIAAGNIDCDLRFSKESTGGTAQHKGYSAFLVRYS